MLDYLAEITMSIMQKQKERSPDAGYAKDFVSLMVELAADLVDRNVRVVSNAGGVNPSGCRAALGIGLADQPLSRRPRVAVVQGDDLMSSLDALIAEGHELAHMDTGCLLYTSPSPRD